MLKAAACNLRLEQWPKSRLTVLSLVLTKCGLSKLEDSMERGHRNRSQLYQLKLRYMRLSEPLNHPLRIRYTFCIKPTTRPLSHLDSVRTHRDGLFLCQLCHFLPSMADIDKNKTTTASYGTKKSSGSQGKGDRIENATIFNCIPRDAKTCKIVSSSLA